MPVNPSLYLIKYDGFDCVYGLELHKDERVQGLEVLPDRLGKEPGLETLNKAEIKPHFCVAPLWLSPHAGFSAGYSHSFMFFFDGWRGWCQNMMIKLTFLLFELWFL